MSSREPFAKENTSFAQRTRQTGLEHRKGIVFFLSKHDIWTSEKKNKIVFTRNDFKVNEYCPDAIKRKQLKLDHRRRRFPNKKQNKNLEHLTFECVH